MACAVCESEKQTKSAKTRSGGIIVLNGISGFIGLVISPSLSEFLFG
jgi:hypothetical protein